MEENCQFNDVVYICDVTRPLRQKVASRTINYHLKTRDIPIRQHFQITCCTGKAFQVKHLTWSSLFWDAYYHTQICQINASCAYLKNSCISQPEGTIEQEIWTHL